MRYFNKALFVIVSIVFSLQLIGSFSILSRNVAPALVLAHQSDDDAANVDVALRTKLWNDNTFRAYGVVYYRMAHVLSHLVPYPLLNDVSDIEKKEISNHYSLLLINFVSLASICVLISYCLLINWTSILFMSSVLLYSFLQNNTWVAFLFRAHPETLFSFLLILSVFLSIRHYSILENKNIFKNSAFSWGAVLSTKLTTIVFLPALFLFHFLCLKEINKKSIRFVFLFFTWMTGFYFLIGFPQNLLLHKTLGFFGTLGSYSAPLSFESFTKYLINFSEQVKFPLLALSLIALVAEKRVGKKDIILRSWILFILPFIILILRNSTLSIAHYTFGFVALFLMLFSLSVGIFIPSFEKLKRAEGVLIFILLILFSYFGGMIPVSLGEQLKARSVCRDEVKQIRQFALSLSNKILVDPYTPFARKYGEDINASWRHTFDDLGDNAIRTMVLNSNFYSRFLIGDEPSRYVKTDTPNWPEVRKFYQTFSQKDQATDLRNRVWKKVKDLCKLEVWTRQD